MNKRTKRCFISIDLPENVKKEILRIQRILQSKNLFIGSCPQKDNMHITIKFLGDVNEINIPIIKERLKKITSEKICLKLNQIGYFGKDQIKVIWAGLEHENMNNLKELIDNSLKDIIELDKRTFNPHITIARVKHATHKRLLVHTIEHINISPIEFYVSEFHLKESKLQKTAPEHITLERFILK